MNPRSRDSHSGRASAFRRGLTLIEVVVAMSIFACGIVALLGAFSAGVRTSGASTRAVEAARLAQRQIALAAATPGNLLEPAEGVEGPLKWRLEIVPRGGGLVLAHVTVEWLQRGRTEQWAMDELFRPRPDAEVAR